MPCFDAKIHIDDLTTYKLSEHLQSQQYLIRRAEEDLFCAVMLCRRKSGYMPLVNICYLLHQSIEKWLKVFLIIQSPAFKQKGHDLEYLFDKATEIKIQFEFIKSELTLVDPVILGPKFPSDLRYNETSPEIEDYIQALMRAVFKTRRLIKRHLIQEAK
jgi:HEPN domain-containing protein